MKIRSLTEEQVKLLQSQYDNKMKDLQKVMESVPTEIWRDELLNLKKK